MQFIRRQSKKIAVGPLAIGGEEPILVQSMTNTDPHDFAATLCQVKALAEAGCGLVRLAVPDQEAARVFSYLRDCGVTVPLCADIHFDYRLAIESVASGADKIRINPGNVGDRDRIAAIASACRQKNIPIRIGVNGGSLEADLLEKYGGPTPEALCESALRHASLLEAVDFYDIVLSVKTSSTENMIKANRLLAERTSYPLHLGVTEAGDGEEGLVRSAVGIGALLSEGIGDTVRVSLTADPLCEVKAAYRILDSLGLSKRNQLRVISCPTCGRTKIDLVRLAADFRRAVEEEGLSSLPLTVALMGCAVNGPGEAKEADIGIAGGEKEALLFKNGQILRKIPEGEIVKTLLAEIKGIEK